MEEQFKACIYTRLSHDDGDKSESNSISNQKTLIREYVKQHPEIQIVSEKTDDGYSGVDFDRPAFREMLDEIKSCKVNCIIVKDLSRLGRNYIDAGNYIERIFPFMGVRFIAVNDNYDSNNKKQVDALIIPFKNLINDAYCNDISLKIRSQLETKRKNGQFVGPFAVYGYLKNPKNHNQLIRDDYAAEVVSNIYRWTLQGMTPNRIAEKLNNQGVLCPMEYKLSLGQKVQTVFKEKDKALWSARSILRILTNEVYTGVLIQGKSGAPNYKVKKIVPKDKSQWIRVENTQEAIIDKETFDIVQNVLKRPTKPAPHSDVVYPFSGYVKCADCGKSMVRKINKSGKRRCAYLVCATHKAGKGCSTHTISEEYLKDNILIIIQKQIEILSKVEDLIAFLKSLPEQDKHISNYDIKIVQKQEQIAKNKKLKLQLYENLEDRLIDQDEYLLFKEKYLAQIRTDEESLKLLEDERRQARNIIYSLNFSWIAQFKEYKNISSLDRNVIISLIENITIYDNKHIEVVFRYQDNFERILKLLDMQSQCNV